MTIWLPNEDRILHAHYAEHGGAWCARAINKTMGGCRNAKSVHRRASKLGIQAQCTKADRVRQVAAAKREAREAEMRTRKCLICGENFPSEWIGNRACKTCKQTAAWRAA